MSAVFSINLVKQDFGVTCFAGLVPNYTVLVQAIVCIMEYISVVARKLSITLQCVLCNEYCNTFYGNSIFDCI